ncbi:GNAT family N-acetyltransferase [Roseobacter cerasinus]|nr:phosphatidylglycerol lysyltransferase domain-containing protein [Roseobacter cerasinus]
MSIRVGNVLVDPVLRHGLPLVLVAICLHSLPQLASSVSLPEVFDLGRALPVWAWLAAAAFAAVSFYSVGQYDVLARRELRLTGDEARAHRNGAAAVALSQLLGFGLITGALARYRLSPQDGMIRASQITALVTLLFLIGMMFVTAFAILFSGLLIDRTAGIAAITCLAVCVLTLVLYRPRVRILKWQIAMPGLVTVSASIFWATADVVTAAAAFYVLLPEPVELGFSAFLPIFCIALAAGILSGVPGGVGPFEVVLLGLTAPHLPTHIDQTCLMTAICGFRMLYYVLPALLAALVLLRPPNAIPKMPAVQPPLPSRFPPRAEVGVIAQNRGEMVALPSGVGAMWPAGNSLVCLFDPIADAGPDWPRHFKHHARRRSLLPVLYKCSARHAIAARKAGWAVVKVAEDAIVAPATFDLKGARFSGLRRKLRKAAKAGVTVQLFRSEHLSALDQIDVAWQKRCGGARGGTMGRFCPCYIESQLLLVAEVDDRPVAFVSLHKGQTEWALDVMRDADAAPDGTMYLLIHEAIRLAAQAGIPVLSLAAVPAGGVRDHGSGAKLLAYVRGKWAAQGLYQFKSAFAPTWKPLYMAAPGRLGMCIGAMDILREVVRPSPLHDGAPCASIAGSEVPRMRSRGHPLADAS